MSRPLALLLAASSILFLGAAPRPAKEAPDPNSVVFGAMAKAGSIPAQAEALAALAWPLGPGDPRVRAKAKEELVNFADQGMEAIWKAIREAEPADKADAVDTLILAFRRLSGGMPPVYLPALDDAIWFGTREARLLAIPEISRFRLQSPVLTIIDAAIEDPEVLPVAVDALGSMQDARARFFLERVLHEGKPGIRERAAVSLSRLGEPGRTILKSATRSDGKEIRLAAIRALLPVATVDDISSFYDYGRAHADDDPATAKAVEAATLALEKALESQRALDAASPTPR